MYTKLKTILEGSLGHKRHTRLYNASVKADTKYRKNPSSELFSNAMKKSDISQRIAGARSKKNIFKSKEIKLNQRKTKFSER